MGADKEDQERRVDGNGNDGGDRNTTLFSPWLGEEIDPFFHAVDTRFDAQLFFQVTFTL